MASTSSTSGVSNGRYWGLASGLNVDSIVTGLLSREQGKIDKAQQSEQKLEWKQSAYRDIIDKLNDFQSAYLEFGTATSMASTNMYTSYTPSSSDNSLVTATATSDATGAAKTIKIVQSATTAALTGTNVGSSGLTSSKNWSDTLNILKAYASAFESASPKLDDPSFNVTVDGVTKSISFTSAELNNVTSASAGAGPTDTSLTGLTGFANLINKKLNDAFGTVTPVPTDPPSSTTPVCKVMASVDANNKLTFSSQGGYTSTISVASTPPAFSMNTVGAYVAAATACKASDGSYNSFPSMTVNYGDSAAQTMNFTAGNDSLAGIQSWLDDKFSGKGLTASVDATSGAITIKDASGKAASVSTDTGYNTVDALGFSNGANNRLNIYSKTLGQLLNLPSDYSGNITANINGTSVNLGTKDSTVAAAFSAIDSSSAGVTIAYDSTTDTVSLTANQSGSAGKIDITGDASGFFSGLGISSQSISGQDAIVDINGTHFTRPSNKFTVDGVTYSINKTVSSASTPASAPSATLTFAQDTSALKTGIQNFVSAYNSLITDINTQIDTVPDSDYPPLTDAQKSQMTNDQINSWNQKAQAGMLNNDDTLQGICDSMRSLLDKSVTLSDGSKYSLYDMGITTSDDAYANGKLEIKTTDETKFANAIATQSSKIMELFTKTSDTLLNINPKTTDEYNTQVNRKNEEGIADRLDDVISAATANVYGTYGSLLQIAGTTTTLTYQNTLYDQLKDVKNDITDLKSQMTDKKNRLYSEFENLETYMEQANAQSSMISSMGKS